MDQREGGFRGWRGIRWRVESGQPGAALLFPSFTILPVASCCRRLSALLENQHTERAGAASIASRDGARRFCCAGGDVRRVSEANEVQQARRRIAATEFAAGRLSGAREGPPTCPRVRYDGRRSLGERKKTPAPRRLRAGVFPINEPRFTLPRVVSFLGLVPAICVGIPWGRRAFDFALEL